MNHLAFEIPGLSLIRVAGVDAIKVLNGLCTAKLVELPAGGTTEAMFTDDRGRVMAHCIVALEPVEPVAWIVGQNAEPAKLSAHIDRFIFREDAQPKDVTDQWSGLLLEADATAGGWPAMADALSVPADVGCSAIALPGGAGWLMQLPMTSPSARLCLSPQASKTDTVNWLAQHGIALGSAAELEDRRIRNFWPIAPYDLSERTLPQELDRDQRAVSFTKGCYLGQETVARLDAMGEVQKKLCLVQLSGSGEMISGQALSLDNKEVGKLTSVSPLLHDGQRFALANMRRGSMSPGRPFAVAVAGATESTGVAGTGTVVAHP